ncbi:MAG: hypothetical protein ACRC57_00100 [Sarcina sp.]
MYCQRNLKFANKDMPEKVLFFKEALLNETLEVPITKPDMQRILKIISNIEVVDADLIETEVGVSNEGQKLSGYKLVVKLRITGKVMYSTTDLCSTVHTVDFELFKTIFIVLPKEFNGESICELVRIEALKIKPYIEADKAIQLDERTFNACILFIVDARMC